MAMSRKVDLVIDIETITTPVTAMDVRNYMAAYEPPANYKTPEALLRHREKTEREAIDTIAKERRFSIGGKRMISCVIGCANSLTGEVEAIESFYGDELEDITKPLVKYLNESGEYRLIGWNHKQFDLPEIAKSFAKTKVFPNYRPGKWDLIDLCDFPLRKVGLKEASAAFGFDTYEVDGSDVAKWYEEKDWASITKYNEQDVVNTGKIYLALSTIYTF